MSPISCPFCGKSSAANAKFCSECGGALHLVPCPACDAVNDVTAASCFQCGRRLAGPSELPADPAPMAAPQAATRSGGKGAWLGAGVAILAAIGVAGYYSYGNGSGGPAPDGAPVTSVLPDTPEPAKAAPAAPPSAVPAPARAERKAVESPSLGAARVPARVPRAAVPPARARGAGEIACTPQAAALNLCSAEPGEQGAGKPAAAPAAARQEDEDCSEVAAALGFCTTASTQGGN